MRSKKPIVSMPRSNPRARSAHCTASRLS
jgi:hypothetical protein